MYEGFDDNELLAYVEGTLSPDERGALEARLVDAPALASRLAAMADDRRTLHGLGDVPLPADFVASLEPQLARPMLLDAPSAGRYRRDRGAARRRRQGLRFAAAAGFLLITATGIGWGITALTNGRGGASPEREQVAAVRPAPGTLPDAGTAPANIEGAIPEAGDWPPADGRVHHWGPVPASAVAAPADRVAVAPPVTLDLVLVIAADEADRALRTAVGAVARQDEAPVALVRNFSLDEARQLAAHLDDVRLSTDSHAPARAEAPARAAASDSANWQRRVARLRRELDLGALIPRTTIPKPESGRIIGAADVGPSYEQQLVLSGRGATHTVTIPLDDLPRLMHELRLVAPGRARLCRPDADGAIPTATASSPWMQWLDDQRASAVVLDALRADGVTSVHVPVVLD